MAFTPNPITSAPLAGPLTGTERIGASQVGADAGVPLSALTTWVANYIANNPGLDFSGLSGVQAWYRPSDVSTVTSSAGAVSQVNDISGNARHATRSSTSKPTLVTSALNGLPGLAFTGGQGLEMDGLAAALANAQAPHHLFAVVRNQSAATSGGAAFFALQAHSPSLDYSDGILAGANLSSTPNWYSLKGVGSSGIAYTNSTSQANGNTSAAGGVHIVEMTWDGTSICSVQVDNGGVSGSSTASTGAAAACPYATGRLGVHLNPSNAEIAPYQGHIYELAFISGQILSGTSRLSRMKYLNARYGLGLTGL